MTKQIFHLWKFKKFGTLKYKSKPTVKTKNFTEGNKLLQKAPTTERLFKQTKRIKLKLRIKLIKKVSMLFT